MTNHRRALVYGLAVTGEVSRCQRVHQAQAADHDDVAPRTLGGDPGHRVAADGRRVRPGVRIDAGPGGDALRYGVHQPGKVPGAARPELGEMLPGPPAVELHALLHPRPEAELVAVHRSRAVPEGPATVARPPPPVGVATP